MLLSLLAHQTLSLQRGTGHIYHRNLGACEPSQSSKFNNCYKHVFIFKPPFLIYKHYKENHFDKQNYPL